MAGYLDPVGWISVQVQALEFHSNEQVAAARILDELIEISRDARRRASVAMRWRMPIPRRG